MGKTKERYPFSHLCYFQFKNRTTCDSIFLNHIFLLTNLAACRYMTFFLRLSNRMVVIVNMYVLTFSLVPNMKGRTIHDKEGG